MNPTMRKETPHGHAVALEMDDRMASNLVTVLSTVQDPKE